jgi:F-type H+-transporting ATPase subunit b
MHLLLFAESIQLFPDGTLFIHVALILAMIWILNRTLYRPINKVLATRERNKGGHSSEAAEIIGKVEEKEAHYNKEMLDARSKGYSLIEKEQKKAVTAREKKLGEAKTEVAEKLETGKAEIEKQSVDAQKTLSKDAEKMADSIAAGILKG